MATASEFRAARPDHNSLGKAAFIIGLIGLILSFIPVIGLVSWLLAPLAILFGLIALRKAPRSLAIAGIVTGLIALFICFTWVKAAQSIGEAMSADTFNNGGKAIDNSASPIIGASIKGLWRDIEDNKIAAGKKYGGHRLQFKNEVINDFGGKADTPTIQFVGKNEEFLVRLVTASFAAADGDKIGALKKGGKASFLCQDINETLGEGYSLSKCLLQ